MKLRNKLMPLAAGLTAIAAVAPISLTSCTKGTKLVDLRNGYTPSIKRAVWENNRATKTDMNDLYMAAVNENADIFVQDFLWTNAINYIFNRDMRQTNSPISYNNYLVRTQDASASFDYDKLEANVTNFSVTKAEIPYGDETIKLNLMSFDSTIKYVENGSRIADLYYWDGSDLEKYTTELQNYSMDVSYTLNIKNIPFVINRADLTFDSLSKVLSRRSSKAFQQGLIPSDWDIGFAICNETGKFNPLVLQILEQFGYEFKIENNILVTETAADILAPELGTTIQNYEYGVSVTNYDQINNDTYSEYAVRDLYNTHIQSYYLSQIADILGQIKK